MKIIRCFILIVAFTGATYAGECAATRPSNFAAERNVNAVKQKDKTLILHYGHASTESRDKAMDVLEKFAGNESLGLGLDTTGANALIYGANSRRVVPEVGLEPT
jgi:hypothetical protein